MKQTLINEICTIMEYHLSKDQNQILEHTLNMVLEKALLMDSSQKTNAQIDSEQNKSL